MTELIGRLHPALVHLPIGILFCAIVMDVMGRLEKWQFLKETINFMMVTGIATSILSLISGYLLSGEGNYDTTAVSYHQWTAISTTIFGIVYVWKRRTITQKSFTHLTSAFMFLSLLTATGHQGGSLTHGEGFLSFSDKNDNDQESVINPPNITNLDSAIVYRDLIQFTLDTKCVSCHGPERQKGKLRLDGMQWIQKGGKNGLVLNVSSPEQSELLKRLLLEMNDDQHMPPKNKDQLTPDELALFQWWIGKGASFDKKVHELGMDSLMNIHLNNIRVGYNVKKKPDVISRSPVPAADPSIIRLLEEDGWVISPIASGQNYLRVTGFNIHDTVNVALKKLLQISDQLVELKLSDTGADDSTIAILSGFKNLEKLWLDNNKLSDKSFTQIPKWQSLGYINLAHTDIGINTISKMAAMPQMKFIYAGFSRLSRNSSDSLMKSFPGKKIFIQDSLIRFDSDTLFIQKPMKKEVN